MDELSGLMLQPGRSQSGGGSYAPPNGNTGVSGYAPQGKPMATPEEQAGLAAPGTPAGDSLNKQPEAPDYSKPGQFLPGHGSGYDPNKGLDGGNTGKYKLRNVLSHFDPKLGLNQPGLMDAVNAAGIGKFRAADGDELVLEGGADPSFGRTRHFDVIPNFDGGNASTWGYLQQDKGGVMGGQQAPALPMMASEATQTPLATGAMSLVDKFGGAPEAEKEGGLFGGMASNLISKLGQQGLATNASKDPRMQALIQKMTAKKTPGMVIPENNPEAM